MGGSGVGGSGGSGGAGGGGSWPMQSGWVGLRPDTTNSNFHRIDFVGSSHGWTVGTVGMLLHTSDSGVSWATRKTGTSERLRGRFCRHHERMGGRCGRTILHTADGGATWLCRAVGDCFSSCGGFRATVGVAVSSTQGSTSRIIHTTDGGHMDRGRDRGAATCGADASTVWAVGNTGIVTKSSDAGATWSDVSPGGTGLAGVSFVGAQTGGSSEVLVACSRRPMAA